jgi:hypothetical protein
MKYYIQRQLSEYGPYTLADLQRYVAQGSILLTDLTRSEGMTEWVAVSQVIGNIPPPAATPVQPAAPVTAASASGTVYGGTGAVYSGQTPVYGGHTLTGQGNAFVPPDFHWGLVLLVSVFTCGLFFYVWMIVEAAFTKKLRPASNAFLLVILGAVGIFFGSFVGGMINAMQHGRNPLTSFVSLAGLVVYIIGIYKVKSDLEEYYNTEEPITLQLSGVMVFFFNVLYFQHHLSRIAQWKKTGVLQPQG